MLTKSDIAQLALGHLGLSQTVLDLSTENTVQAKVIRRHFRSTLDRMLMKHEWGFATHFGVLNLREETPVLSYQFAYNLPNDCLVPRIIAMDGYFPTLKQYEKEKAKFRHVYNGAGNSVIYSNVPNAHIEYTLRVDEDYSFPAHFAFGLSHLLALDIAPSLITANFPKIKQELMMTSRNEITLAIADDLGMEPQQEDSPTPFISCRQI